MKLLIAILLLLIFFTVVLLLGFIAGVIAGFAIQGTKIYKAWKEAGAL